jgi:hypothetical protein
MDFPGADIACKSTVGKKYESEDRKLVDVNI